jgi:tetratricopeptide (TPR) repeat protein
MNYFKQIFLLGITFILLFWVQSCQSNEVNAEQLFESYFESYPVSPQLEILPIHQNPFSFYKKGDYSAALTAFQDHSTLDTLQEVKLYQGISALANNQLDDASASFLQYKNAKGTLLNEANWYLGLTFLRMKDFDAAKVLFKNVATNDTNQPLKKKAQELLKML